MTLRFAIDFLPRVLGQRGHDGKANFSDDFRLTAEAQMGLPCKAFRTVPELHQRDSLFHLSSAGYGFLIIDLAIALLQQR